MIPNEEISVNNCPCKGCDRRSVTCHSNCEGYIAWKKAVDKRNRHRKLEIERYCISDTKKKWLRKQQRKNARRNSVRM